MKVLIATILLIASMSLLAAPAEVIISVKDANRLLAYLVTQPYEGVYQLIPILISARAVPEVAEPPEKEAKSKAKKGKSRKSKESKK